jgi:hypothetical protein
MLEDGVDPPQADTATAKTINTLDNATRRAEDHTSANLTGDCTDRRVVDGVERIAGCRRLFGFVATFGRGW